MQARPTDPNGITRLQYYALQLGDHPPTLEGDILQWAGTALVLLMLVAEYNGALHLRISWFPAVEKARAMVKRIHDRIHLGPLNGSAQSAQPSTMPCTVDCVGVKNPRSFSLAVYCCFRAVAEMLKHVV